MTSNMRLNSTYTVTLDGLRNNPGLCLLVVSDRSGFFRLPGFVGPELSAIPGGAFTVLVMGRADSAGDISRSYSLGTDPAITYPTWTYQAALLADSGADYLSSAISRNIGD